MSAKRNVIRSVDVHVDHGKMKMVCNCCHHIRLNQPYAYIRTVRGNTIKRELRCWMCCRDYESTRLIAERWPSGFVQVKEGPWYRVRLREGIQRLIGAEGFNGQG